jgi:hypothetical protein
MVHKEFNLIVKVEILENAGYSITAVHYKVGDVLTVDEDTFNILQSGKFVERYTREGIIRFDKYNFENEVSYTELTVQYGTRKLGQRKNK